MRRRTPSEIKAYGDGYTEAYKEFCHLLKNHDVDKAMRKMKIFADAVVLTVETATDEPQTEVDWKQRLCDMYGAGRKSFDEAWEKYEADKVEDEPQTDCAWK